MGIDTVVPTTGLLHHQDCWQWITDGSGKVLAAAPNGFNIVGTCKACGGAILSPQLQDGNLPDEHCQKCGRKAKKDQQATFGPLREMEEKESA